MKYRNVAVIVFLVFRSMLFAQTPTLVLQKGHFKKVNSICFSKDGRQLVTTGADGTIKLWDAFSQKLLNELESSGNLLSDARFIQNDKYVVANSASLYQTTAVTNVWNAVTGEILGARAAYLVKRQADSVSTPAAIWDADGDTSPNGKLFVQSPEKQLQYLPDSPYMRVTADTPVFIYTNAGGAPFRSITDYMDTKWAGQLMLGFLSDSSLLIARQNRHTKGFLTRYAVYNFISKTEVFSFSDSSRAEKKGKLLFGPGGRYFLHCLEGRDDDTQAVDPSIEVWNITAQKKTAVLPGSLLGYTSIPGYMAIAFMEVSRNGQHDNDTSYTVAILNNSGQQVSVCRLQHPPSVSCFSNNGQYLATGYEDGDFGVWDITGPVARQVAAQQNQIDPVLNIHNDWRSNKMFYITRNMYGMQPAQTSGKIAHLSTGNLAIKKHHYFLSNRYCILDVGDEGSGQLMIVSNDTPSVIASFSYQWDYIADHLMGSLLRNSTLHDEHKGMLTAYLQHPELQSVSFYSRGIDASKAGAKWRVDNGPPASFVFVIIKSLHAADTLMLFSSFGDFMYNNKRKGYIYRGYGNYFMSARNMAIKPLSDGIKLMWSVISNDANYVLGRKPDEGAKFRVGAGIKADPRINSDAYLYCLDLQNNFRFRTPLTYKEDSICNVGSFVLSPNGETACILSSETGEKANFIRVINARTGAPLYNLKSKNSSFVSGVEYTKDGRNVYSWSEGGGACVKWDIASGTELYSLVFFNDHDYAIILSSGYYYLSSRADARYLNFKLNSRLYNFSQFDLQFNRPDLVLKAIGSSDTVLINNYFAAWEGRVKKAGFSPQEVGKQLADIPQVTIEKDSVPSYTQQKEIDLHFRLQDSLFNISRYNVFINDVPINGINGRLLSPARTADVHQKVLLTEGINKIEINCVNNQATESRKETVYINYAPLQAPQPKTYFIGIGINQYRQQSSFVDLSYCVKDIRDLSEAFRQLFKEQLVVDTLFNGSATKEAILALRSRLLQSSVDDKVILSFSGHGMVDPANPGDFYFVTGNTRADNPSENGVSYAALEDLLDSIPARKKLLLLDACHSGESNGAAAPAAGNLPGIKKGNDENGKNNAGSIEIVDVVENNIAGGTAATDIFKLMKEAFVDIRRNNGAYVLSAAQSNEAAGEGGGISNGWFTSCIIEQIRSRTSMTINELSKMVNSCVNQKSGGNQNTDNRQEPAAFNWQLW